MQDSDNIYKITKLNELEQKISKLEDTIDKLKKENKNLRKQDFAVEEEMNNTLGNKEELIRDKIEAMIEQIDRVLD